MDLICGLIAANGIQAALLERARTGRGRHVEVSLMDAALTSLLNQASAWVAGGVAGTRRGNRHPSIVPYETYDAADRPIAIAVGNDRLFARLCGALGLGELPDDERFATNAARVEHRDELSRAARRGDRARDARRTGSRVLRAAAVPVGPINGVDEAFALAERARDGADGGARRRPARAPAAAPRRRAAGDPPRRRPRSTSTATRSGPGCGGPLKRLEPPS